MGRLNRLTTAPRRSLAEALLQYVQSVISVPTADPGGAGRSRMTGRTGADGRTPVLPGGITGVTV